MVKLNEKFVIPFKQYKQVNDIDLLKQKNIDQNVLNNTGGSKKKLIIPSFDQVIDSPYDSTSKFSNNTYAKSISNAKYDKYAFDGGKKIRSKNTLKKHTKKKNKSHSTKKNIKKKYTKKNNTKKNSKRKLVKKKISKSKKNPYL